MIAWLPSALIALVSFGLWGFFSKLALLYIDSKSALVFQTAGALIIGVIVFSMLHFKTTTDMRGVIFGLLTGLAYGVGCLFYLIAADKGKVTTVVTLTALYPLITILLSYFILKEQVSIKQCLGIIIALISIFLMST